MTLYKYKSFQNQQFASFKETNLYILKLSYI